MAAVRWCPLCQRGDLRPHCPALRACSWERCPKCCVTFCESTRTAYDANWRDVVTWPKNWIHKRSS